MDTLQRIARNIADRARRNRDLATTRSIAMVMAASSLDAVAADPCRRSTKLLGEWMRLLDSSTRIAADGLKGGVSRLVVSKNYVGDPRVRSLSKNLSLFAVDTFLSDDALLDRVLELAREIFLERPSFKNLPQAICFSSHSSFRPRSSSLGGWYRPEPDDNEWLCTRDTGALDAVRGGRSDGSGGYSESAFLLEKTSSSSLSASTTMHKSKEDDLARLVRENVLVQIEAIFPVLKRENARYPTQILRYTNAADSYGFHTDCTIGANPVRDRAFTALVYLTTVGTSADDDAPDQARKEKSDAGSTIFPLLGNLAIRPLRGRLVVFSSSNSRESDSLPRCDPLSLHASKDNMKTEARTTKLCKDVAVRIRSYRPKEMDIIREIVRKELMTFSEEEEEEGRRNDRPNGERRGGPSTDTPNLTAKHPSVRKYLEGVETFSPGAQDVCLVAEEVIGQGGDGIEEVREEDMNGTKDDEEEEEGPPRGRIVGCVCLKRRKKSASELKHLCVRMECRGRGIGRRLVETLLRTHARLFRTTERQGETECYCGDIYLDTLDFMRPARRLYESVGFRTLRTKDLGGGVRLVTYRRRGKRSAATTTTLATNRIDGHEKDHNMSSVAVTSFTRSTSAVAATNTNTGLAPPSFDTNTLVHIEGIGNVVVERTGRIEIKLARSSTDPYNRLSLRQNRKLEWTRSSQTSRGSSGRNAAFEFVASSTSAYHFAFRSVAFKKKGYYVSAGESSSSSVSPSLLSVATAPVFLRCVERSANAFATTPATVAKRAKGVSVSDERRNDDDSVRRAPSALTTTISRRGVRSCSLREALACEGSRLTRDAIRRDGVLVVRDAISPEKIARALRCINHGIGQPNGLVPGGVQPLTYKLDGKHANDVDIRRLFPHALVRAIVGEYDTPTGCQIALRYPEWAEEGKGGRGVVDGKKDGGAENDDDDDVNERSTGVVPLSGRRWHTDPLRQGKFHPFSLLVGIALSDTTASGREGNFCVFPGKHVEIGRRTTLNGRLRGVDDIPKESEATTSTAAVHRPPYGTTVSPLTPWGSKDRPLPDLGPPVPVRLRRGDVVLCHVDLPHRGGPNFGSNIRYMCYFRVRHRRFKGILEAMKARHSSASKMSGANGDEGDHLFADLQGTAMRTVVCETRSTREDPTNESAAAAPTTAAVMRPAIQPRVLSSSQIERFRRDGIVVVPNILSDKEVAKARAEFEATLRQMCGFDKDRIKETAETIRALSSTGGAGGVLDLFYAPFKLRITLANERYANAYSDLLAATYASNDGIYAHDFGSFDPYRPLAHVDRVGYRLPDDAWEKAAASDDGEDNNSETNLSSPSSSSQRRSRKRRVQRSLTPHLDCAPLAMDECAGKPFKRWRPIQCLLSLSDTLERNQGGFEGVPGFHREFRSYFLDRRSPDSIVSVSDFTSIRARELVSRVRHVPVPRGAAVFWDQRIIHANSARNESDVPRACVYGGFLPRVSRNVTYAREQLRRARKRMPQSDFWMHPSFPYLEGKAHNSDDEDPIEALVRPLRDDADTRTRHILGLLGAGRGGG
eukprot:g2849.t1